MITINTKQRSPKICRREKVIIWLTYKPGLALMTDYYGAFSTSTSNFPGQIQSATIDTSDF